MAKKDMWLMAHFVVFLSIGIFLGTTAGIRCNPIRPHTHVTTHPVSDCDLRLRMEQNLHGEYYHNWLECDAYLGEYFDLSRMAVCLDVVDEYESYLDSCEAVEEAARDRAGECEHELLQVKEECPKKSCHCLSWCSGGEAHCDVIEPGEACMRHPYDEDSVCCEEKI